MRKRFMDIINFDDFSKLKIRVGKIIDAETVTGSNKLIKMKIDIGDEERQIVAGIGSFSKFRTKKDIRSGIARNVTSFN